MTSPFAWKETPADPAWKRQNKATLTSQNASKTVTRFRQDGVDLGRISGISAKSEELITQFGRDKT